MSDNLDQDRLLAASRVQSAAQDLINSQNQEANRYWDDQLRLANHNLLATQQAFEIGNKMREIQQQENRARVGGEVAAAISTLNLDAPDADKQLMGLRKRALEVGMDPRDINSMFEYPEREMGVKMEFRERERAAALGESGLDLYDAFREIKKPDGSSMYSPQRSSRLARESVEAERTLSYWQDRAEKAGVAFILDENDWAKVRQKIGEPPSIAGEYDGRPVVYNFQEVMNVVRSKLTPEFVKKVKAEGRLAEAEVKIKEQDAILREQEATVSPEYKERARLRGATSALETLGVGGTGARGTSED